MRNALRAGLLITITAWLVGCGAGDRGSAARDAIRIAAVSLNGTDPFWITVACGARAEAERLGVRLDWSATPTIDLRTQATLLETTLLADPDGLILVPASETTFVSVVERLMSAGTPVDVISGRLARPVEHRWVGTDPSDAGGFQRLARRIARHAGGSGSVAILAGIPGTVLDAPRRNDLVAALERVAPGIRVLPPEYPGTDRAKAAATVSGLLLRHRDLRAVYATSGPEGTGAAQAIREAGRDDVAVYAYDATPEQVAALRNGEIDALLAQSPQTMGRAAVRSLVAYARAHRTDDSAVDPAQPRHVHTPSMVLTRENLDRPAAQRFIYRGSCDRRPGE